MFATCFIAAPNLFTNLPETIRVISFEARPTHEGADGLSFFGNFLFYLSSFLDSAGYESIICVIGGIYFCLKKKNIIWLGMGLLYWICMSALHLHWVRWGMPIYIFYVVCAAIGLSYFYDISEKKLKRFAVLVLGFILIFNSFISSILYLQTVLTPEARVDAIKFCNENGITEKNSLFDGYSPLFITFPKRINAQYDENGNMNVHPDIKYLIISSYMYQRYYNEPQKYASIVSMYDNIQKQNELIYSAGGNYYKHSNFGVINIIYAIKGLLEHNKNLKTGSIVKIYRIPENK